MEWGLIDVVCCVVASVLALTVLLLCAAEVAAKWERE